MSAPEGPRTEKPLSTKYHGSLPGSYALRLAQVSLSRSTHFYYSAGISIYRGQLRSHPYLVTYPLNETSENHAAVISSFPPSDYHSVFILCCVNKVNRKEAYLDKGHPCTPRLKCSLLRPRGRLPLGWFDGYAQFMGC